MTQAWHGQKFHWSCDQEMPYMETVDSFLAQHMCGLRTVSARKASCDKYDNIFHVCKHMLVKLMAVTINAIL